MNPVDTKFGPMLAMPSILDPVMSPEHPHCNFCVGMRDDDMCTAMPVCIRSIFIRPEELEEYEARKLIAAINRGDQS